MASIYYEVHCLQLPKLCKVQTQQCKRITFFCLYATCNIVLYYIHLGGLRVSG
jgi:hypothetical protein